MSIDFVYAKRYRQVVFIKLISSHLHTLEADHLKIPVQSQAEKESASVILREKILTALGVQRVPVDTAECIAEMHLNVQADLRKPHQLLLKRNKGS